MAKSVSQASKTFMFCYPYYDINLVFSNWSHQKCIEKYSHIYTCEHFNRLSCLAQIVKAVYFLKPFEYTLWGFLHSNLISHVLD